jgi:hypothetical protein
MLKAHNGSTHLVAVSRLLLLQDDPQGCQLLGSLLAHPRQLSC